jgi:hypothetical protein
LAKLRETTKTKLPSLGPAPRGPDALQLLGEIKIGTARRCPTTCPPKPLAKEEALAKAGVIPPLKNDIDLGGLQSLAAVEPIKIRLLEPASIPYSTTRGLHCLSANSSLRTSLPLEEGEFLAFESPLPFG